MLSCSCLRCLLVRKRGYLLNIRSPLRNAKSMVGVPTYTFKMANAKLFYVGRWCAFGKGFEVQMLWAEVKLQSLKKSLPFLPLLSSQTCPIPQDDTPFTLFLVVASLHAPPPYNLTFHTAFWFWNLLHLNCPINTTLQPLPGLHPYNQKSSLSHSYIPAPAHQPDDSKPWFAVVIFNFLCIKKDMWFYPKCHFLLIDRAHFRYCVKKDSEVLS